MSAALPDRYGVETKQHVVTNNFLVSIGIIVGACGVAVMASSIVVKTGEFYEFANYALTMLKTTQLVELVGWGALLFGFLGIVVGFFITIAGLFVKQKALTYISLGFLLILAVANIVIGSYIQQGMSLIDSAIYTASSTPAADGTFTANITAFQLSMFNACCASQGPAYSKEVYPGNPAAPETVDEDGYVKWCGALKADNLAAMAADGKRSCYPYQETYRIYNYTVGNNIPKICTALTDARVNIVGKTIPGTSIDVTALTGGIPVIPVAGPNAAPTFGCGIGYAKAFQAAILIWAENILSPVGTAFIACGAVYVFLLLISSVSIYSCSRNGETAEERYARYLEEINSSSQATQKNQIVDGVIVEGSFEQANPNRASVNMTNSNRASVNMADPNRASVNMQPIAAAGGSNRMSVPNPRNSVQSYASQGSSYQQPQQQQFDFNVDDKI